MLIGGILVSNPYCMSPDELLHRGERREASKTADGEIEEAARWYFDETIGST